MGRHSRFKHLDDAQFLRYAEIHVDALNDALANIPADRMRIHVCWGNYEGPHTHDIPLVRRSCRCCFRAKPIGAADRGRQSAPRARMGDLDEAPAARRQGARARRHRHQHQLRRASRARRPAHRRATPTSVGRDRVIAGTDCGMGTFAGFGPVHPDIAWAKLRALVSGARLASQRLWKPAVAAV